ncbi:hypothetical protein Scep_007253 [Stephania cephalantha]|uniref:Uncharacterized protein n=1 Tax=Stephania cephalantha TaxID=152367 RepID=A0AAP0PPU7_9MAGN
MTLLPLYINSLQLHNPFSNQFWGTPLHWLQVKPKATILFVGRVSILASSHHPIARVW